MTIFVTVLQVLTGIALILAVLIQSGKNAGLSGAINGIAAIGIYFTSDGGSPFVGPAPTGIIGMLPFIVVAIIMVINLQKTARN